jgi:hypothetical protein
MKRLLPWAIAAVASCALLLYYATEVALNGAFAIPVQYGWNVPVPHGGSIVVRGLSDVGFGAEDARFEATYRPAQGPDEPIGTWYSETWNPVAYGVGAAIVFLPDASHPFVRTARGQWKPLLEAPNDVVRHISPDTRLVIVDRHGSNGERQARLFMQLSMDGERLTPDARAYRDTTAFEIGRKPTRR